MQPLAQPDAGQQFGGRVVGSHGGALEPADIEDVVYAAAARNALLTDAGER